MLPFRVKMSKTKTVCSYWADKHVKNNFKKAILAVVSKLDFQSASSLQPLVSARKRVNMRMKENSGHPTDSDELHSFPALFQPDIHWKPNKACAP